MNFSGRVPSNARPDETTGGTAALREIGRCSGGALCIARNALRGFLYLLHRQVWCFRGFGVRRLQDFLVQETHEGFSRFLFLFLFVFLFLLLLFF